MSMLYDPLMCINYQMFHAIITRSYTKTYLSNVNINSALKLNFLNREHA